MSDAQNLYEQHDNLEECASALRAKFNADAGEFGGWDAEEDAINTRFDEIEERLERLHGIINKVEQIEIDRSNSGEQHQNGNKEGKKELIGKAQRQIHELNEDINILKKDIDKWYSDTSPGDNDQTG